MRYKLKISFFEYVMGYLILPALIIPLCLVLYMQNEIDQLEKAFILGFKYTAIPFFILFSVFLIYIRKNLLSAIHRSILFALLYAGLACFPIALINNHFGTQSDFKISGIVIDKKPGRGTSHSGFAEATIRTKDQDIKIRIIRSRWRHMAEGVQVSIKAKKGSLGLLYY